MKITSQFESGLTVNLANFNTLIAFCKNLGSDYKPSSPDLNVAILEGLEEDTNLAYEADRLKQLDMTREENDRDLLYDQFGKHTTRIMNALEACFAPREVIKNARTFVRKIQGKRASLIPTETNTPATAADPNAPAAPKTRSSSQTKYENKAEFLAKLINLLQSVPVYKPNEFDLSVAGLQQLHKKMVDSNKRNSAANAARAVTRLTRMEKFNHPVKGLVAIANAVKKYIKSVYGAGSPQYKEISGLKFSKDRG